MQWSIETKILTCQLSDQLLGILETIITETKDENLKQTLTKLKEKAVGYRKHYQVEGVKQGDFKEIYPILKKTRGKIKHKTIYPKLLSDLWGYPEASDQIERKAKQWLKQELPNLQKVARKLAKIYNVKPNVETVDEELNKRKGIPKQQALQFVKETRSLAQKIFENNIVKITPKYETRVIETPHYLVSMIPTAAMTTFDSFTDKPFNVFFVTTDPRFSPSSNVPDLISSLLHEEYGHAVNFSNSVTRFAAKPTFTELIASTFATHISDGISFYREYEFVELLKKLVKKKTLSKDEEAFLKILRGENDKATMLLENEFTMQTWRIMRFLRAVFDVRINMEKQSIADFVEWAHKETGLSEKMIYNQTWIFLETVGYAPCYSIAGDKIRRLQQQAIERGISKIDFNTYIASLGFPAPEIFEQKVQQHIASAKKKGKKSRKTKR
jgi:sulfur relay (sulfurtransferase) DsrC/TusE family protein